MRASVAGASAIVVAHPDDEILWLSGLVSSAGQVVFCFGDPFERPKLAAARRQAVAALPLPGLVDLQIPESGARFSADWTRPRLTPSGIEVTDDAARARYEANFLMLVDRLRPVLAGCGDVYTHNPWGEYGHTEHIQVHRAVVALQAELGFTTWFSNYVGARSWPLAREVARQPCWTARRPIAPDRTTAHRFSRVYRRHGAWTWSLFHRWPAEEMLYAQAPAGNDDARYELSGERLLDVAGLQWWAPWRRVSRRLD
ncbi:PIG-L family deacetylase [Aliidongia dinghuensis]|uniref:PIG-L family deacetylase n=1 Tax=Aliidongia dinghuensis TaxID=1867774 RepID=UPI00166F1CB7|nr:PIG-L family deacetylase [Aliidongia dinghuensis]